jgi:hypothetical protein
MDIKSNRVCACGRRYSAGAWATLPLHARLTAEQIKSLVSPWRPHLVVEIRVCGCMRKMARLGDAADQAAADDERAVAA